ncbi:MAG: antA/AntB antirepressor family protein [Janthinobacterium lividum]
MQELIKIEQSESGPIVSARELHGFLESKRDFATWIKDKLAKHGFTEGLDFSPILGRSEAGRQTIEYALTLDTAKELGMLEGNEKGREIRRYFIEAEKHLRQSPALPQSQAELILMIAQQNVANEKRLLAVEQGQAQLLQAVAEVKAQVTTVPTDFFTVAGWASLQKKSLPTSTANALGRKAAALSKAQGFEIGKVGHEKYGAVNSYHRDVLRQVLPTP